MIRVKLTDRLVVTNYYKNGNKKNGEKNDLWIYVLLNRAHTHKENINMNNILF